MCVWYSVLKGVYETPASGSGAFVVVGAGGAVEEDDVEAAVDADALSAWNMPPLGGCCDCAGCGAPFRGSAAKILLRGLGI